MPTYLFITGWEFGHQGVLTTTGGTPAISAVTKRTGNYSLDLTAVNSGVVLSISGQTGPVYVGVAVYPTELATTLRRIIQIGNGGDADQGYVASVDNSGNLALYVGTTKVGEGGQLTLNTWTHLQLKLTKIVGETTSIALVLYQDGVLVASGSSLITNADTLTVVYLADPGVSIDYGQAGYYDDFAVCTDGYPGRGGIEALLPSGAGTSTDLTPSAGDNYAAVDEVPPDDDTTYVSSDTSEDHDSYAMGNLTLEGTVMAVQWNCYAKLAEEGTGYIKRVVRSDGTDYTGDVVGLDTTYDWYYECFSEDPATDAAWDRDDVDAMELGVMIYGS